MNFCSTYIVTCLLWYNNIIKKTKKEYVYNLAGRSLRVLTNGGGGEGLMIKKKKNAYKSHSQAFLQIARAVVYHVNTVKAGRYILFYKGEYGLKLCNRITFKLLILVFKVVHFLLPTYISYIAFNILSQSAD